MTWAKGTSGNPGGRVPMTPEMREAKQLARDASPNAVRRLIHLMEHAEDERVQKAAADSVVDIAGVRTAEEGDVDSMPLPDQVALLERVLEKKKAALRGGN